MVPVPAARAGPKRAGRRRALWRRFVWAAAVLTALMAVVWLLWLPQLAERLLARQTRFDVAIGSARANPFAGEVELEQVVIDNPATFGPREFMRVEQLRVHAPVRTWWGGRREYDEVTLDLPLVAIVTNTDGTTNLDLFRERLQGEASAGETLQQQQPEPFLIRRLHLKVGEIRFINLTTRRPRERTMKLDLDITLQNVTAWKQLLVPEVLQRVAFAGLAFEGLSPEDLGSTLREWTRRGGGLLREPVRGTTETLKSLFEKLEDSPKP